MNFSVDINSAQADEHSSVIVSFVRLKIQQNWKKLNRKQKK